MGGGQFVQIVRLALVADEMRVTLPAVIIHAARFVIAIDHHQQRNRLGALLRCGDGIGEQVMIINAPVHANDFHPGADTRLESRAPDNRVDDRAVIAQVQANRVHISHIAVVRLALGRLIIEQEFPAAVFDPSKRRVRRCRVQSLVQKLRPVIRSNCIQLVNDVLERVRFDFCPVIRATVKRMAEIVDAFLLCIM